MPLIFGGLALSIYAFLRAGFTAEPLIAILTLLAPVALLVINGQMGPRGGNVSTVA
jgi:hypothetical protein